MMLHGQGTNGTAGCGVVQRCPLLTCPASAATCQTVRWFGIELFEAYLGWALSSATTPRASPPVIAACSCALTPDAQFPMA